MKVALELLGLVPGQIGGMEAYVRNLFREFVALGDPDELRVLLSVEAAGQFRADAPGVTEYVADTRLPSWCRQVRYGRSILQWLAVDRDLRKWRPDVLHCTMFFPRPAWAGRNMVLTVHDLHFINYPNTCGWLKSVIMNAHCRIGVRRASRIITLSENSKRDIVRHYGVRPENIDVVYLAVDHETFRPPADPDEPRRFRKRHHLPADYLLYPANTWPHKNHVRLLEALALLRDREGLSCPLVLTGARKRGDDAISRAIDRLGLGKQVCRLDYVPTDDLALCYQAAGAVVFPSLHEGFGLPVLEAMACGTPVACSKTTSVGEVAGSAAELFDPEDPEAIAAAIARTLGDSARRERLSRAGQARAGEFTWQRTARQTLGCYAKVCVN
jgi:glycosyltransferase involved in cell wall biosynthesis